jgi:hypothetical protein
MQPGGGPIQARLEYNCRQLNNQQATSKKAVAAVPAAA